MLKNPVFYLLWFLPDDAGTWIPARKFHTQLGYINTHLLRGLSDTPHLHFRKLWLYKSWNIWMVENIHRYTKEHTWSSGEVQDSKSLDHHYSEFQPHYSQHGCVFGQDTFISIWPEHIWDLSVVGNVTVEFQMGCVLAQLQIVLGEAK